MGVVGSILAHELGVDFTWSDPDLDFNAWGASVPIIRPGSPTYKEWVGWVVGDPWWSPMMTLAPFYFTTKRPPEGARVGFSATERPPWKEADGPAIIINAQHLVLRSRVEHMARRTDGPEPGDTVVVAHGFNDRLHHYLWGWSCLARLSWPGPVAPGPVALGPVALDHRVGKFVSAYAAPVPHEAPWHRVGAAGGTGLRYQLRAKECDVEREKARWEQVMAPLGVSVSQWGAAQQGWRPAQARGDDALALRSGQRITLRPMSHSGFALAPRYVEAVKELL
jgi:hypothetical protein